MYREMMIICGAFVLLCTLLEHGFGLDLWRGAGMGVMGGVGGAGGSIYRGKFFRTLKESVDMPQEAQTNYLRKQGGAAPIWKTLLFVLLFFAFTVVVEIIFFAIFN